MSEQTVIAKNTASLFLAEAFGSLFSYALFIILAYGLGDSGLGKYTWSLAFAGFFAIFYDFGIDTLLIREIAGDKTKIAEYLPAMFWMRLLLMIPMIFLPLILVGFFSDDPIIIWGVSISAVGVFCIYFSYFFRSILQAMELIIFDAKIKLLESLFQLIMALAGFKIGKLLGALIGVSASQICILLISIMYVKKYVPEFKLCKIKKGSFYSIFWNAIPFWFTGTFLIIYYRLDTLMIKYLRDFAEVGLYNSAMRLISGFNFFPKVVLMAIFPVMARYHATGDNNLNALLQKTMRILLHIAVPMAITGYFLSSEIINSIYSNDFAPAAKAFSILVIGELFFFLVFGLGNFFNAINKPKVWSILTFIGVCMNIVLNYFLIKYYGFVGAAFATTITQGMIFFVLSILLIKSGYKLNLLKTSFKISLASMSIILFLLLAPFSLLVTLPLVLVVIIKILISCSIYFGILLLLREFPKSERDDVLYTVKSFFKRFKQ